MSDMFADLDAAFADQTVKVGNAVPKRTRRAPKIDPKTLDPEALRQASEKLAAKRARRPIKATPPKHVSEHAVSNAVDRGES